MLYTKEQVKEAKKIAANCGITKLMSVGSNVKLIKSDKKGKYLTIGLSLAPADSAGKKYQTCPSFSKGCKQACLATAGFGGIFKSVTEARIKKTKFWFDHQEEFKILLWNEMNNFVKNCKKKKVKPAARLNVVQDIIWEKKFPEIFTEFPEVHFYNYTKVFKRFYWDQPQNHHLTFSRSESNQAQVLKLLKDKPEANVAVVFKKSLPKKYLGREVIDGTEHDLRFVDKPGVIVGLVALGKGRKDNSGFVVDPNRVDLPVLQ